MDDRQHAASAPSYYQQHPTSSHGQTSVIRPPQGFAWESSGSFRTVAHQQDSESPRPDDQYSQSSKKRSKDKSRSKSKHKSKDRSRDEYHSPAFDHHESRGPRGPSSSETYDDPPPRRSVSAAHRSSPEYSSPSPPQHDLHHNSPYYDDYDMQPPRTSPEMYPQRGPSVESMAWNIRPYSAQLPNDGNRRRDPLPPRGQHGREPYGDDYTPPPATQESQQQEYQQSEAGYNFGPGKPRTPRLLTLLIEDMRLKESQLAEVRVPLIHRSDGQIWADALDITEVLQSGPARIDGPARVSTMRGEYKQIFFRVSASGEVNCKPANIQVSQEKTVQVIVEDINTSKTLAQYRAALAPIARPTVPPPGMLPAPRPVAPPPAGRVDNEQYDPPNEDRRRSLPRKRRRSVSHEASYSQGPTQRPQPRQTYRDVPPATHNNRASVSTCQRGPNDATSTSDSGSGSGTDTSADSSGLEASPHAQPSQITPPSQAESLGQLPHASVSNTNTIPPAHPTLEGYPNQHLAAVTSGPPASYPPAQRYTHPGTSQQKPPPKKQRHNPRETSASRGQPPMGSLTPPPTGDDHNGNDNDEINSPVPQLGGAFSSYSNIRTTTFGTPPTTTTQTTPTPRPGGSQAPTPFVIAPSAPSPSDTKVDDAVALYLRGIFRSEPEFTAYLDARNKNLPVSAWIRHLEYVQMKFEQFVGKVVVPGGVSGEGGVITKAQACRAFYQNNVSWGDECSEVVALSKLYGPNGSRTADPDAVDLYNEPEGVTTTLQMRRYLGLLKTVHGKWVAEHSEKK